MTLTGTGQFVEEFIAVFGSVDTHLNAEGHAVVFEAILSFLGAGTPPEIPSWGNIMSEGRTYFQLTPWIIFFPGIALALTVLAVNTVGDGLRDTLDPRIARKM